MNALPLLFEMVRFLPSFPVKSNPTSQGPQASNHTDNDSTAPSSDRSQRLATTAATSSPDTRITSTTTALFRRPLQTPQFARGDSRPQFCSPIHSHVDKAAKINGVEKRIVPTFTETFHTPLALMWQYTPISASFIAPQCQHNRAKNAAANVTFITQRSVSTGMNHGSIGVSVVAMTRLLERLWAFRFKVN